MGLLADIKLTEEQEKAVVAQLNAWKETERSNIEKKYKTKLQETEDIIQGLREEAKEGVRKSRINEDGQLNFTDEEAEIMNKSLTEWQEKIQEETEDALGDKFMEVYKQGEDKLKKSYSEKFIKTLKTIYEEVEVAVREKLMESAEFKTFKELKKLVAPHIVEGEYKDTIVEDINKYKEIIMEQKQKLEDIKIKSKLDQLTSKMPKAIKEDFINNLGEIKTEDELVEKFEKHVRLMKKVRDTLVEEMQTTSEGEDVEDDNLTEDKEAEGSEEAKTKEEPKGKGKLTEEKKPEEKPAEKKPAPKPAGNKAIAEDVASKSQKKKSSEEDNAKSADDDIDYEILSEEFKRPEEKEDGIRRMQELAGLV